MPPKHFVGYVVTVIHKLIGCKCPNCGRALPFSATGTLFGPGGEYTFDEPLDTFVCQNCDAELIAKGTRTDHAWKIVLAVLVPWIIFYMLDSDGLLAFVGFLMPLLFIPRIIGIKVYREPADVRKRA